MSTETSTGATGAEISAYGIVAAEIIMGTIGVSVGVAQLDPAHTANAIMATVATIAATGYNIESRTASTLGKTQLDREAESCARFSGACIAGGLVLACIKGEANIPGSDAPPYVISGVGALGLVFAGGMAAISRYRRG